MKLKYAKSRKKIIKIYRIGPSSCMKGKTRVGAYSGPDLALAYIEDKGTVMARSLVWPKEKLHTCIYARSEETCHLMKRLLTNEGYRYGSFVGARLNRKHKVPSLDCALSYAPSKCGRYNVLTNNWLW